MAGLLETISIIAFVLSGVFFVLALVLLFRYKIFEVFGNLNGRTAKKSIEQIQLQNEKKHVKKQRPQGASATPARRSGSEPTELLGDRNETVARSEEATQVLGDCHATVDLSGEETAWIAGDQTEQLEESAFTGTATALLVDVPPAPNVNLHAGIKLRMLDEIMIVHTNEVIESEEIQNKR